MRPSNTQKTGSILKQSRDPPTKKVATKVPTSKTVAKSIQQTKVGSPKSNIITPNNVNSRRFIAKPFPTTSGADYFCYVPNEIIMEIIQYLDISAFGMLSTTCNRFRDLLDNSVHWQHFYLQEFSCPKDSKNLVTPLQWKNKLRQDLTSSRRKKISTKFKNSFTSMKSTEALVKTLRLEWKLQVNDQVIAIPKKRIYTFPFTFALFCTDLPDFSLSSNIAKKDKIRLLAKHIKNISLIGYSPYIASTSTILKSNHVIFSTTNWSEIYRDDLISVNEIIISECNHMLVGLWIGKDTTVEFIPSFSSGNNDNNAPTNQISRVDDRSDKEVAFFIHSASHLDIVTAITQESSVASKSSKQAPPRRAHVTVLDDIDTTYGLHDYTVAIHIRTTGTSKFYHMFDKVTFKPCESQKKCAVAVLIKSEGPPGHRIEGELSLPWKAGAFSKSIPKMTIMDFVLLDERKEVMWAFTRAIALENTSVPTIYDHPEDSDYFSLRVRDKNRGTLEGVLLYSPSMNATMVTSVEVTLNTDFVNKWFGTRYTF